MADDIASLVIRVESLEAEKADKRLSKLEKQGAKTERATDGLTGSFKRLAAPLAGIVSISAGLNKLFDVTKEIQNLNVQLQTATGSAEGAAQALDLIKQFANETGQPVNEVAQAFVKLKNLGLDPSEKALMSYGNTAAAMGKDLDQLIEAVADAATGEFERLKEFGIKSRSEGENVSFTFQGVTTTVKKSAEEIEGYLQGLGETQFAGALEAKAQTLEGSINQLENSWNELFEVVSQQGSDEFMADAFNIANDALKRFTQSIASGELEGYVLAIGGKFEGFATDVINAFTVLEELFRNEFQLMSDTGVGAVDLIGDAFLNMPENIRAAIQIAATELAYFVDRVSIFGEEIAHDLNPANWFEDSADFDAAIQTRIDAANSARASSIETILEERDAKISNYEAEVDAVNKAAEAHAKLQAAKNGNASLGDFGSKKGGENSEDEGGESSESTFSDDFELLKLKLELEEAAITESYVRRQQFFAKELKAKRITQAKFDKETYKNLKIYLKGKEKAEAESGKRSLAMQQGFAQAGMQLLGAVFAQSKSGSKAMAKLKTIESVVSSYARGAEIGGPYLGAAFAATALLAQTKASSQIDGVSIGGGGSVSAPGGGSVPDVPALPDVTTKSPSTDFSDDGEATQTTGNYYFNFHGPVNQADSVMDMFREAMERDEIPIPPNSRQAQVIRDN